MNTTLPTERIDLAALVRAGDRVVCAQGLAEPVTLTRQLVAQRAAIGGFSLFIGPSWSGTFLPEHADCIEFRSYCGTGGNAQLAQARALAIVPAHYSELPRLFAEGVLGCDVVLLSASGPDADGRFNLGLTNDYVIDAARRARLVIVEASTRMPWVHGADLPDDIRPHIVVHTDREPLTMQERPQLADGREQQALAGIVAGLVPDGATLELGIGALPDGVLSALRGHRDLGIHSGVIGDGVAALMEAGVITNAHKPIDRGVSVAGLLMGSRSLFDYAHRNPRIRLASPAYTHAIAVMCAIPDFIALNGAIEVDLSGQVNAESLDGRYIGAVGGQLDFVRGARASRGGRSIMLLPATARQGRVSRVVARLPDHVVTTPRSDADLVVTEYGVAELRGKSLAERAKAMIAIAHPDFREALERQQHANAAACRA